MISHCSSSSSISAAANASLRAQLGESQTALRAKDAELAALVQERDRLVKKLADQEEGHKAALKAVQDREATLQTEYETEAAGWAEARQTLVSGYGQIEDLVDGKPPTSSSFLAICHFGSFSDLVLFSPFFLLSCAEYFPGYSTAANQTIEARRQARRQAGFEISPTAGRSLEEQLLAIQARIQPAHRLLRRL